MANHDTGFRFRLSLTTAVISQGTAHGTVTAEGEYAARITTNETNQLVTGKGKVARVIITNVGSGASLDVYDATSGTTLPIYRWVTAEGKGSNFLNCPFQNGLRVITGGTFGEAIVTWS